MSATQLDGSRVIAIQQLLAAEECASLIARGESLGFKGEAGSVEALLDLRNNAIVSFEDPALAGRLWLKVTSHLSERREAQGWVAVGVSERFRLYRYRECERFGPHYDASIQHGDDEESRLTLLIYLNEGCQGGETRFYRNDGAFRLEVSPERGKALLFDHFELHEGAAVLGGCKYVLHAAILFRNVAERLPDLGRRLGSNPRLRTGRSWAPGLSSPATPVRVGTEASPAACPGGG